MKEIKSTDVLLVGYDTQGAQSILIVGKRRPNGRTDILNMFAGPEADELYQKLTTKKDEED